MKKIIVAITLFLSSVIVLTGCNAGVSTPQVNKKEEAVKAAKANIEGILKGDKTQYDAYYGAGKYDEKVSKELEGKNSLGLSAVASTPEKQKELFTLGQAVLSKAKIDYEEKSDTEVTLHIHQVKIDQKAVQDWILKKVQAGTVTQSDLQDSSKVIEIMFNAIKNGEIALKESKVVDEVATVKEVDGKFVMSDETIANITKLMFDQSTSV